MFIMEKQENLCMDFGANHIRGRWWCGGAHGQIHCP
jgi:hypothetical protein